MSNQIVISSGAKVRELEGVLTGTAGIVGSVPLGAANGVATLDSGGKVPVSQLPASVVTYLGTWNAATNTPTLTNGVGDAGDMYICNVAGTVNFGAGPVTFAVGDWVLYGSGTWQKSNGQNGTVTSVGASITGNAIGLTGSPITTAGTLAFAFAGTNLQYVNGAGNLTTFPTLITSIGLSMPSAFNVANSPLTANGTIAVTAAGYASQYIRGDGTLADFPSSGGGGSSVSYYLNGGTSQGTIGGTTYYEMSKTADTGTGVDFTKLGDGFIVAFLTDANDPAQLNIPAGNWNFEIYASMSSNGGIPQMYAELYKYDGTTFTLISTSSNEILYDGTNLNLYTFGMTVPATTLTLTDRLAIKLYATNSGGKTTTVHTQDSHLCQIITTFSTGITALNGLTAQVQYFQVGTSGTDFNIVSSVDTHTFNLPTASATVRGALSSADWSTFNGKQPQLNGTGFVKASGTTISYDNSTYALDSAVVKLAGTQTITGAKTFSGYTTFTSTVELTSGLTFSNSGFTLLLQPPTLGVNRTVTLPNGTGTLALTSDIPSLSATAPISYSSGVISISQATTSTNGYLSSTDWNTFNGKQAQINGTGFVKASGTTISYDNSTYALDSDVVKLTGNQTIGGTKTFSLATKNNSGILLSDTSSTAASSGYISLAGYNYLTNIGLLINLASQTYLFLFNTAAGNSYTFPNATGTVALTSDISYPVTSVFGRTGAVVATEGDYSLTQLSDVTITSPSSGQVLRYNGTSWVNSTESYVGTVTSVGLSSATSGVTIGSSPITTSGTITLAIATASGSQQGLLSSTDWTTFNNKQNALTNPVTGTGFTNYLPKFTGTSTIGNSAFQEDGTNTGSLSYAGASIFNIIGGSGNSKNLYFTSNGNANPSIRLYQNGGTNDLIIALGNGSVAPTNKLTLTETGNLGLGVTPSAWGSILNVNQFGNYGAFIAGRSDSVNQVFIGVNAYYNGTSWLYSNNSTASRYYQDNGKHIWDTAPSGTAGNAITFTQAMTLTASGRLLINTPTESTYQLDVNGTGRFSNAITTTQINLGGGASQNQLQSAANNDFILINSGNFRVINNSNTVALLTIANSGAATFSSSVSVNGASAIAKLSVYGTSGNPSTTSDTYNLLSITGNLQPQLNIGGYNGASYGMWMQVKDSTNNGTLYPLLLQPLGGNVGIGTTSPSRRLQVASDGTNWGSALFGGVGGTDYVQLGNNGLATIAAVNSALSAYTALAIQPSGGNVLIGDTTDYSYKLYVNGGSSNGMLFYSTSAANQIKAAGTAPAITFSNTITSPTIGGSLGSVTSANQFLTGTAAGDMILINQFTGNKLYITNYSGGVYLTQGATSWTANSDIRLKNINSYIENAVEKLSTLQTINFSYKDDKTNKQNLGLIAQEVEKIFPELIDKNGDGMLGVRYTELVPVLIKAVQELKLEIETLKNK